MTRTSNPIEVAGDRVTPRPETVTFAHLGNAVRAAVNTQADHDLEAWIQERLVLVPGERVLDVGAGTGKQSVTFSRTLGPSGEVVACDLYDELPELRAKAESASAGCGNLRLYAHDANLPFELADESFDAIVCTYAVYYLDDLEAFVREVTRLLKPSGRFFVVGPAWDNAREFYALHEAVGKTPLSAGFRRRLERLNTEVVPLAFRHFGEVRISPFVNRVHFAGSDGRKRLADYYRSTEMWAEIEGGAPAKERAVEELVARAFADAPDGAFYIHKRALGVLCRSPRPALTRACS
jgi:ubiquinone/menaquinone biosynthesis C-methylase UbiE